MPTPAPRTPICIARGNLADLQASLADIEDGEICYAYDENAHYMKAFGSLTKVAGDSEFSGDYNDLTNKPTIGAGVITIKQGGTTKGSFNVNQTSPGEINLDAGGGGSYTLPPATAGTLGGIKVGSGLSVLSDGTLSADGGGGGGSYTLPPATNLVLGGIKVGDGLAVTGDGTLSANAGDGYTLPAATSGALGGIKVGGGLAVTGDGTLSANAGDGYTLLPATTSLLGGIKVGEGLAVTGEGVLSANAGDGYTLSAATASELGGIKVGGGLAIDAGVLSVTLEQGTVYKGVADFTDAGAEPNAPENGWIYSNTTAGTAAWTGISGETVDEGVQAIWSADDSTWSLIASAGSGVTEVTGTAPITVDVATNGADHPIVGITNASETAVGAVQFANDTQIANGTALVAVQASQLKTALDGLEPLPVGTATGDLLQWNGTAWEVSNVLDGGTY